jgi:hypothetical protein
MSVVAPKWLDLSGRRFPMRWIAAFATVRTVAVPEKAKVTASEILAVLTESSEESKQRLV